MLSLVLLLAAVLLQASPSRLLHMFRQVLPFILLLAVFQWLFTGPQDAILSSVRISLLYIAGSIVTATTAEAEFVDAVERLLSPVSKITCTSIGRDIAIMMALAIAFLPLIKREHDAIRLAQEARGVSYDGIEGFIKGETAVLVPLIYALEARADRVALAMEARCYGIKK